MKKLTQQELKKILHYDPESGVFTWLVDHGQKYKAGDLAGTKDEAGYLVIFVMKQLYKSHRLAWLYVYGEWPSGVVDHINHNKADNMISNLRDVTNEKNQKNKALSPKNKMGIAGIRFSVGKKIFVTKISRELIGEFDDFFEACCARKSAERKYEYHINHGISA